MADLTSSLATRLAESGGVPRQVRWPEEWQQWLSDLSELKVYALRGMGATVHVVAAFSTCVRFEATFGPEILPPGQDVVDLIRNIYREWSRSDTANQAAFTFFTIGSVFRWTEQVIGCAAGDHWLVVSGLDSDGTWETSTPPRFADRPSLRSFLDRLKPETLQQRISKIKHFVDDLLDSGYQGNILVGKVANATGYQNSVVRDALLALQRSEPEHYRLYRLEGRLAVGLKSSKLGTLVTAADLHQGWLSRLACLSPAVTVGIWFVKDVILGRPFDTWAFAALLPLAYAGEWLNTRFRRVARKEGRNTSGVLGDAVSVAQAKLQELSVAQETGLEEGQLDDIAIDLQEAIAVRPVIA